MGRVVRGGFLGFAIMLLAALIPILHFVTGPHLLGPILGGFFGGSKVRATPAVALGIGGLMGLLVVLPGAITVLLLITAFHVISTEDRDFYVLLTAGVSLWIAALGALGAWAGGRFSLRASRQASSVQPVAR